MHMHTYTCTYTYTYTHTYISTYTYKYTYTYTHTPPCLTLRDTPNSKKKSGANSFLFPFQKVIDLEPKSVFEHNPSNPVPERASRLE